MKPKLTIVLVLIVITPLAIVGWLGARIVQDEQVVLEHQLRELMLGQLRAVDTVLGRSLERYEQAVLGEMRPFSLDPEELRRRSRQSPYAVQYYVLDEQGRLLFPPVGTPGGVTASERESLVRTSQIWDSGVLAGAGRGGEGLGGAAARQQQSLLSMPATASSTRSLGQRPASGVPESLAQPQSSDGQAPTGWHVWYWGDGIQMILWARDGQQTHAAEINRARLLADLIAALPDTDVLARELAEGRIRLADSAGRVLYQWGSFDTGEDSQALATLAVGAPLGAWSLQYHAPSSVFGSAAAGGFLLNLAAALAVLGAAVIGLSYYFYREQSREMHEAAQRVSFVNQVSHELKTPLTNIRMYAELLEKDLDEPSERLRRHLGVIVSESQRLSRLIGNVLTFSRKQREALELCRRPGVVDDVLRGVLDHFRPALEAKQIEVEFEPGASESVSVDADAVEQIAGNLISNVEKYGAEGKRMEISSQRLGNTVEITVADRGPGLASRERQRIFEPFYRVSNALTDGVSGTGMGLAISRDLARLHGGDLELVESEQGARFRVTLECPPDSSPRG